MIKVIYKKIKDLSDKKFVVVIIIIQFSRHLEFELIVFHFSSFNLLT